VYQCQQQLDTLQPIQERPLFRPPYGRITRAQAKQLSPAFEIVMWDVLTNDYDGTLSPEKCLHKAIKYTRSGSIILFHDSLKAKKNMMYGLPLFLEHFTNLGYTFKTL
jgi:hypothetical protein